MPKCRTKMSKMRFVQTSATAAREIVGDSAVAVLELDARDELWTDVIIDTSDNTIVGWDSDYARSPEDSTLARDYKWVVKLLNKVASGG